MNYKKAIDFLFSQLPAYHRIGKAAYKNNLNNTLALDDYFGNPHNRYRTIHVAGTNGKGSVSHMIASILQEAGYRTGLYTSPHLKDFRERIKINGKMISKSEVSAFISRHQGIIEKVKPSFFEMTVAMAFDYFARENVDVAVIETGLGGRLDSTNIIRPVISVITNIGHDHMDLLGNSIVGVASEKAGIIKKNVPVVIGETQNDIRDLFISRAAENGSKIFFADRNFSCSLEDSNRPGGGRSFTLHDIAGNRFFSGIIPLGGDYQAKNLQTLFQVFSCLRGTFEFTDADLIAGVGKVIVNTGLKGRWQVLRTRPLTICDTGHNKEGLEYVMRQIGNIHATGLHMVIGFVSDKDITSILPVFPMNAKYYFTKAAIPRALDENILKMKASEFNLKGECYPSVNEALKSALLNASDSDLIFIGGSTFVVAEVI